MNVFGLLDKMRDLNLNCVKTIKAKDKEMASDAIMVRPTYNQTESMVGPSMQHRYLCYVKRFCQTQSVRPKQMDSGDLM